MREQKNTKLIEYFRHFIMFCFQALMLLRRKELSVKKTPVV